MKVPHAAKVNDPKPKHGRCLFIENKVQNQAVTLTQDSLGITKNEPINSKMRGEMQYV